MGTSDFIYDLLDRLKEDDMDYLLITVDKGSKTDRVELFYEAGDSQSEQCMVYCFKKLVEQIKEDQSSDGELKEIDYGWVSQDELDDLLPPPPNDEEYNKDDDEDEKV